MPELQVTFTLRDRDLALLRNLLRKSAEAAAERSPEDLSETALKLVEQVRGGDPPDYVRERLEVLETVARMATDEDWPFPASVRDRVRMALAYFADPEDAISDEVPVLGFLDDAIVIDLIAQEMRYEIQGYRDFCRFRAQASRRGGRVEDQLHQRRKRIRAWIQARQAAAAEGRGWRLFRLW
jgi:hypothetical protein